MMFDIYPLLRPAIHALDAEKAHELAIKALRYGAVPPCGVREYPTLQTQCFGLGFPSPVGLAAGFDKNAEVYRATLNQGFGFVEVGTVTPKPQPGNPKPRLFRLPEDEAVINRLGFNNHGMEAMKQQLIHRNKNQGIVGINIGKNKTTEEALKDYTILLKELGPLADYITINISSPNTQGLRDLQQKKSLVKLLSALTSIKQELEKPVPLLLKIAPDMDEAALGDIVDVVMDQKIDGLIISNTTIARPSSLKSAHQSEQGGLSGRPLMEPSTELLRMAYRMTEGKLPLIGVGGIASGADALAKIRAGASLVQLYSALVYQGFALVQQIKDEFAQAVEREGASSLSDLVGVAA